MPATMAMQLGGICMHVIDTSRPGRDSVANLWCLLRLLAVCVQIRRRAEAVMRGKEQEVQGKREALKGLEKTHAAAECVLLSLRTCLG